MKKIFTLIALAAFGFGFASAENIDSDEYAFTMQLLDEAPQDASGVVVVVGVNKMPLKCDVFQAKVSIPDGAAFGRFGLKFSQIPEDYYAGLGVDKETVGDIIENKTAKMGDNLLFCGIDHTLTGREMQQDPEFADGFYGIYPQSDEPVNVMQIKINGASLPEGKNYITLLGGPANTVFSCKADDKIWQPISDVKLLLYKHADGTVSAIETINANDVPVAQKGIYNLMGVKVNRAEPGQMYIIDGKKVIPTSVIER